MIDKNVSSFSSVVILQLLNTDYFRVSATGIYFTYVLISDIWRSSLIAKYLGLKLVTGRTLSKIDHLNRLMRIWPPVFKSMYTSQDNLANINIEVTKIKSCIHSTISIYFKHRNTKTL